MEALVRWDSPALGWVPPAKFIPIVETWNGRRYREFRASQRCAKFLQWQQSGLPRIRLAMKFSTVQLARPGFAQFVAPVLAEMGLDPALLELEITESAMMTNLGAIVREIEAIRQSGVKFSIDDFGTGYSSSATCKLFLLTLSRSTVLSFARWTPLRAAGRRWSAPSSP